MVTAVKRIYDALVGVNRSEREWGHVMDRVHNLTHFNVLRVNDGNGQEFDFVDSSS